MTSVFPIQVELKELNFPGGSDGKSVCLQCGRPWFEPWVGKIPWRRKWKSTPVFLPEKSMEKGAWQLQSMGLQRAGHYWRDLALETVKRLRENAEIRNINYYSFK